MQGGLTILKFDKNPLIYSVSHFTLGGWSFILVANLPKQPVATGLVPTDIYVENCVAKPCPVGHRPFRF